MKEDPHLVETCVFYHAWSPDKGDKEECRGLESHKVGSWSGIATAVPAHHLEAGGKAVRPCEPEER